MKLNQKQLAHRLQTLYKELNLNIEFDKENATQVVASLYDDIKKENPTALVAIGFNHSYFPERIFSIEQVSVKKVAIIEITREYILFSLAHQKGHKWEKEEVERKKHSMWAADV
ncbi:hypothetical protein L4D77_15295 [Photobacterium frigidiphilum]|uniref:hypothetical protein n=1 Tax=Photobacterium frigidiphilum TaxID=264736 RepID=UPI003D0E26EF